MTPPSPSASLPRLTPVAPDDAPFLASLFRSGPVAARLALLPEPLREQLLAHQEAGQLATWRARFGDAGDRVVRLGDERVGRLWTARLGDDELRVVDIALAPAHRGRGLGTALLEGVIADARREGRRVTLRVARDNPALRLYLRRGFAVVAEEPLDLELSRAPDPS